MRLGPLGACGCAAIAAPGGAAASTPIAAASVAELVVTAPSGEVRVMAPTVVLTAEHLFERQPPGLAQALDRTPGVAVRVNSRGESVARVRGSEERHTQVFLDGAPVAVPWDGRFDLGVLPAGLIGRIEVVKGSVPMEYGANTVAGVAALETRRAADGGGITAMAEAGGLGFVNAAAVGTRAAGRAEFTLALGRLSHAALAVADVEALPFSQAGASARTNTDLESWSGFAAAAVDLGALRLRASWLRFAAERGVAPEGHLDPAIEAPRFWRYPDFGLTHATLNAEADLGEASLRVVGWRQWFGQTVVAYHDVSYAALRSRQVDEDETFGGRFTLDQPIGPVRLRWSVSAQSSTHGQTDTSFPAVAAPLERLFRQDLYSLGVEADLPLSPSVHTTWGVGYDRSETPLTGDKPVQTPFEAPAFSAAWRWNASGAWRLTATAGRRSRFPNARELFDESLGRFLPNPDLEPETTWLGDLAADWNTAGAGISLNPFVVIAENTISQRMIRVGGVSRRQRFNLEGSTSYGVDITAYARLAEGLSLEAGASLLSARASDADGGARLPQRPSWELEAALQYVWRGAMARAELHHAGEAVDLGPGEGLVTLPKSTVVDLRGALPLRTTTHGEQLELTLAIDNVTDALILPQLGLPAPGRLVRLGVRLRL